jgi:hypothetical protein
MIETFNVKFNRNTSGRSFVVLHVFATVISALVAGAVVAWGMIADPKSDSALCWSCGLRDHHKLWCPNR